MSVNLDSLDEDLRKRIQNLKSLQNNLEFIVSQRIQMESNQGETELAIEELEKVEPEEVVYKSIGGIMVKSNKDKLLAEKKSQNTSLEMRIKTLKQKEERTRSQIKQLSQSLQSDLQQQQAA
ncbi:MAG: prefoldin subunit beta [Candidatus Lokiarchaeota archaeon]|nr:prefoldin subunit beta [Candidatus Lokiarchaeota archaeon]MBD3199336.1 prefoldin subunit beta [Candidatus Lokiarchaeota archaeon]